MKSLLQLRHEIDDLWKALARPRVQLMEICGTHTMALARTGLRPLLPEGLRLVSGPGCPVCVTDQSYIDQAVHLAGNPKVIIATYGDMIRVPGELGSLEQARSRGSAVEIVYAAYEAIRLAQKNPDKEVVFLAVGFETTTPATALTVIEAKKAGVKNLSVFCAHKTVLPAMNALLDTVDVQIDGFLCPGHVSVMIGWRAYEPIVAKHRRPCVVGGFDEEQILSGIHEILRELAENSPKACTIYPPVTAGGNAKAQQIIAQVFQAGDQPWRALGVIPGSGLDLRAEYADFDTRNRFELPPMHSYELPGCLCGQVITGKCIPTDCTLFGRVCTPRTPVGPCMVSSEGSCAAHYKYHWRGPK